jgi:hypothetical protein
MRFPAGVVGVLGAVVQDGVGVTKLDLAESSWKGEPQEVKAL